MAHGARVGWAGLGLVTCLVATACGGATAPPTATGNPTSSTDPAFTAAPVASAAFQAKPGAVTLVAYSTPKAAYDSLIPLFQATPEGAGVQFETSYGASGDQSRAVAAGLPADVVAFSLAPDVDRLVAAGMVAPDWSAGPYGGMVTDSVVVFVVRKGNPLNIRTWDDLIQPGIGVIEPNPFTSGGARWNVMAAYGAWTKQGLTPDQAVANLTVLFSNVVVQDSSARNALQTFVAGQGDVMLAYENEAIAAQHGGQDLDYVVPDATILIENPVAVTSVGDAPAAAAAFVGFLTTPAAQSAYAANGYRPVVPGVTPPTGISFPAPAGLFTIGDLGGWPDVTNRFFDRADGIVAHIEMGIGVQP
jgi:sulfate/thiosulfate transport system substrate-binding protein